MKVSAETVARTIILAVALFNQILVTMGYNTLPIEDETITQLVSCAFTVAASVAAWWKNNSFTREAIKADEDLKFYKGQM